MDQNSEIVQSSLSDQEKLQIQQAFEKKFTYSQPRNEDWKWPSLASGHPDDKKVCLDEKFAELRDRLNLSKDSLSNQDIKRWHAHTCATHLAGTVCNSVRLQMKPELCTQAWCKFMEILCNYPILSLNEKKLSTVHLCEAPGSFITCINHYFVTRGFLGRWKWIASTLNPYYEGNDLGTMIADDRFIRNTLTHWVFGDGTGDLMQKKNFKQLCKSAHLLKPIKLVTADGSIDCQNSPSLQESTVSHLHCCEVFAAVKLLSKGGSFVIKFFTMFENNTIGLMYFLVKFFEKVNVFKPATSKPGNSESYVICTNFLGLEACSDKELLKNVESVIFSDKFPDDCLWNMSSVPLSFIKQHINCCEAFTQWQVDVIRDNLRLYQSKKENEMERLTVLRDHCLKEYISRYNLCKVLPGAKLMNNQDKLAQSDVFVSINFQFKHEGTFTERMNYRTLSWKDKLKLIDMSDYTPQGLFTFLKKDEHQLRLVKSNLKLLSGKYFSVIRNSRLCNSKLIEVLNNITINCEIEKNIEQTQSDAIENLSNIVKCLLSPDWAPSLQLHTAIYCSPEDLDFCERLCIQNVNSLGSENTDTFKPMTIFANATSSMANPGKGEILDKKLLLAKITFALQNLKPGDNLILLTHPLLTRFTAGLVLLAYDCFKKLMFLSSPAGQSLQQLLVFSDFTSCPTHIIQHMQYVQSSYDRHGRGSDEDILEVVPMKILNKDIEFFSMIMERNQNLLKCFIYTILKKEKNCFSDS